MNKRLARERESIEAALVRLLPKEGAWPVRLNRAMRYAVLGGGKRIRPVLARLAHRTAGGDPDVITEAACGLELIHTYSLVHDDLPALDDDVLRRGRATVHVEFDEPTAIMAGDALLTEGLLVLARYPVGEEWAGRRVAAVQLVAEAVSSRGMVGGQMEDLESAGQLSTDAEDGDMAGKLERIHRHKTGRLLQASVELGALLAGVDDESRRRFSGYGASLGLAFQVADDILDCTATAEELGKSPGKDDAADKLTWVTLFGLEAAQTKLGELEEEMVLLARELEGPSGVLAELAHFVVRRRN
ncbi:MAG: polyprenyl synthetase family protein [Thermoanaerobaculales bacterium]|nr:polyprenyl synthetase family protein [Thermoanaerobaculales bacterium]